MLHKCANQACSTPFRRLREGKLFQVETEYFGANGPAAESSRKTRSGRRIEHYWLCDACSPFVTLTFDQQQGVITVPLPDGAGQKTVKVVPIEEVDQTGFPAFDATPRNLREVKK
jgi:hypothetical protein